MFRLASKDAVYNREITIKVPSEHSDAEPFEVKFIARFVLLGVTESAELLQSLTVSAYLKRVLIGWDGIEDANGKPLAFTAKNLNILCDISYWIRPVFNHYMEFIAGEPGKNSEPPPAIH